MIVEIFVLALASTIRPTSLAAVYALLAHDARRGLLWVYVLAGLASVSRPLVYRAIRVLRSRNLVVVAGVTPGHRAPRRTELVATREARRMVEAWLVTPVPRPRDLRWARA